MSDWKPIETAPRDQSCLVYKVGEMMVGQFDFVDSDGKPQWVSDNCVDGWYSIAPTHWMPLPEPPK